VADAGLIRLEKDAYEETIDATGKQIYPGFIAPIRHWVLLKLMPKSSDDESEII
jgi:imidazolonepropionase-like amidohydrolase